MYYKENKSKNIKNISKLYDFKSEKIKEKIIIKMIIK